MPTSDSTSGPLNGQLSDLAAVIPVGQASDSLNAVHDTAAGRRRRRNALGGCLAAVALVAGGVAVLGVVSDGDGSDTIAIEGAADTAPDDTTVATGGQAAPGEGEGSTTETVTPPPEAVSVQTRQVSAINPGAMRVSLGVGDAESVDMAEWIVPWQGGFLAASSTYVPAPLPDELPEEIIALFPPEVVEFFNGELPPTIDEAITMLSEADLLDEVTAVLESNPDAAAAIYGSDSPPPTTEVVFSADGIDWAPIDFVVPEGLYGIYGVQSTGTRLAVAVQQESDFSALDAGRTDQTSAITVATTTDLVNWEIVEVDAPGRPVGLPDVITYGTSPSGLAINDAGWMLFVDSYADIDLEAVLPDDLRGSAMSGGGYGSNWDDEGVRVDIYGAGSTSTGPQPATDENGEYVEPVPTETLTFTWDELGVDPASRDLLINGSGSRRLFTASWGEAPVEVDGIEAWSLAAGHDGFYATRGDSIMHSVDGVAWTEIALPEGVYFVSAIKTLPEGIIVLAGDELGASMLLHLSDASAEWERLEIPGAPPSMSDIFGDGPGAGVAMIVDANQQDIAQPVDITVEADGYTMLMQTKLSKTSVQVTDSVGTVVVEETIDWRDGDEPTGFRYSNNGVEILDDDGEVIVTFGNDVMEAAYTEQYGVGNDPGDYSPDLWLVATADGERWLVEDLDVTMDDARFGPSGVVLSGNILLVNVSGVWDRYDLS